MKKYSILLAIIALVLASLACQTIMAGSKGDGVTPETPGLPDATEAPQTGDDAGIATVPPVITDSGDITIGGESPFPVLSDATNVINTPTSVTYQTQLSADDVMKFYRDELGKLGYSENTSMTTNFSGIVAMFFEGNGKSVVLAASPVGDDTFSVTVAYQQ